MTGCGAGRWCCRSSWRFRGSCPGPGAWGAGPGVVTVAVGSGLVIVRAKEFGSRGCCHGASLPRVSVRCASAGLWARCVLWLCSARGGVCPLGRRKRLGEGPGVWKGPAGRPIGHTPPRACRGTVANVAREFSRMRGVALRIECFYKRPRRPIVDAHRTHVGQVMPKIGVESVYSTVPRLSGQCAPATLSVRSIGVTPTGWSTVGWLTGGVSRSSMTSHTERTGRLPWS